jgi:hypothetical protein
LGERGLEGKGLGLRVTLKGKGLREEELSAFTNRNAAEGWRVQKIV